MKHPKRLNCSNLAVDEEEVIEMFGGCLPVAGYNRKEVLNQRGDSLHKSTSLNHQMTINHVV